MRRLPSTDLYFGNVCADVVARWWRPAAGRRWVRRLSANAFVCGEWLVLIRHDQPAVMSEALAWPGRLAYVIDDDIVAGADCPMLPEAYRARLTAFERSYHRALTERADLLLVSSDPLAEVFANASTVRAMVRRIEPAWNIPLADQTHFAALEQGGVLRIAHLGSGSHAAGLDRIAPLLVRLLDDNPLVHFTYIAARGVHPSLEGRPRVRRVKPKPWPRYRRWLARQRFHLALYPLMSTRFERARSSNKLIEHAITGAVGLYPEGWTPAQALGEGAFLAPSDPGDWGAALKAAMQSRAHLAEMARTAARLLSTQDASGRQRALWGEVLGIDFS